MKEKNNREVRGYINLANSKRITVIPVQFFHFDFCFSSVLFSFCFHILRQHDFLDDIFNSCCGFLPKILIIIFIPTETNETLPFSAKRISSARIPRLYIPHQQHLLQKQDQPFISSTQSLPFLFLLKHLLPPYRIHIRGAKPYDKYPEGIYSKSYILLLSQYFFLFCGNKDKIYIIWKFQCYFFLFCRYINEVYDEKN